MGENKWVSVSIPKELIAEIEEKKPKYMSISEFVRGAISDKLTKLEALTT